MTRAELLERKAELVARISALKVKRIHTDRDARSGVLTRNEAALAHEVIAQTKGELAREIALVDAQLSATPRTRSVPRHEDLAARRERVHRGQRSALEDVLRGLEDDALWVTSRDVERARTRLIERARQALGWV